MTGAWRPELPELLQDRALSQDGSSIQVHGSAVAIDGKGILILGAAGAGKSTLALSLMAFGATLIADDGIRVTVSDAGGKPVLHRPDGATDLIEARGVGLLHAGQIAPCAPLELIVDLDHAEADRLPPRRMAAIDGVSFPLIRGAGHPTLAPVVLQMVRVGRAVP